MSASASNRRLAAIMVADVVGYSRMMEADEAGTLAVLKDRRKGVLEPVVKAHGGRIVKVMGDGVLVEFGSAVNAVQGAIELQKKMAAADEGVDEPKRVILRIGINLGDVIGEGSDIYGEGVNIAARLESLAEPGGICISDKIRAETRGKIDIESVDMGEQTLKNIAERIRAYQLKPVVKHSTSRPSLALPDKPSIAVLPFENIGGDPEQEYFADGMVEEIITALSRIRWLFVIARNSSFIYKGRAIDIKQVGRELGVRYVLEGSVRKAGGRLRVTAQLIEAMNGAHLWSDRYDREISDTFVVQDAITESVVGAIEPELQQVEQKRAARKSVENMDAWEHYARGLWRLYQFSADDNAQAEKLMLRAIDLDATSAPGYIGLARTLTVKIFWGWSKDIEADRLRAAAAARRALELDERDPYSHYVLTWAGMLKREHQLALAEARKAIDLMPSFALAHLVLGVICLYLGRFDQVSDPIRRAMRLSPHEPLTWLCYYYLGLARYHQGDWEEAAVLAQNGIASRPFHLLYRVLAACYGQLDRLPEARAALADMQRLMPTDGNQLWEMTNPYVDPAHRAQLVEGLRKAGMPG